MSRRAAVAALLGVLLAAGCGSSSATEETRAGEPACPPLGGGTGVRSGGQPRETMLLTDVETAREQCADRIAFAFRAQPAAAPGYRVEYRPTRQAQTEDGSGNHIAIEGSAFLVVRFEPAATADLSGEQLKFT